MPYSVIVGGLHKVEGDVLTIGGRLRITLAPGVKQPDVPIGTSLTIIAIERDGIVYAQSVRATPPELLDGPWRWPTGAA